MALYKPAKYLHSAQFIMKTIVLCMFFVLTCGFKVEFRRLTKTIQVEFTKFENVTNKDYYYQDLEIISPYNKEDTQIEKVNDLLILTYIFIRNVGQEKIPIFQNLPHLRSINLSKNNLVNVATKHFSQTPLALIYLNQNQINDIEDGSFGQKVVWVNLACNNLEEFSQNWFVNPKILSKLNLAGNLIKYIPEKAFDSFTQLNDINLSFNQIGRIGDLAFSGREQYDWLCLNNNKLTEIDHIFGNNKISIDNFDISYNQLNYVPMEFLQNVNVTQEGIVSGNPWNCLCYQLIKKWYHIKEVTQMCMETKIEGFVDFCVPNADGKYLKGEISNITSEMFCSQDFFMPKEIP